MSIRGQPDFVLLLGSVGFRSFEIPASITESLEQQLVIHRYPGGSRTIDAMGPQRGAISWSGTMEYVDAEDRRNMLESMVAAGISIPLTYSGRALIVALRSLETVYKKFHQIDYTLTLEVVQDLAQPVPDPETSIDDVAAEDLNEAVALAASIGNPLLSAAIIALDTYMTGLAIATDTVAEVEETIALCTTAQTIAAGAIPGADLALSLAGTASLFASATDPLAMIASVGALVAAASVLPATIDCNARVGRTRKNMQTVEG